MTAVDRWLLPDGVDEILPDTAIRVERLRRKILDLYDRWGYDLVIPPLVEFTDSLLSGSGSDLDLMTFKVTDQISGRMMGVRADMTPQTARMDAHSLCRNGPSRLCYEGTVLYTRQRSSLESRCPIQVGVELYGEPGIAADIEVISLMLETLSVAKAPQVNLDLGHVGIYRSLMEAAGLDDDEEAQLFDLLQRKAVPELEKWIAETVADQQLAIWIRQLVSLAGDETVLDQAREIFAEAPAEVELALDELQLVVDAVKARASESRSSSDTSIYLDLGELRGYHYHTGIVFAAYVTGMGKAVGNGGRYDHVGEAFGRPRPATGFSMSLKMLADLSDESVPDAGIYAPSDDDIALQEMIADLRDQGERVVCGFPGQAPDYGELGCNRKIEWIDGVWKVSVISGQ